MYHGKIDLTKYISVVIITRNRVQSVMRTLQRLHDLPESFAIYVVDNHSTDNTAASIQKYFPEVTLISLAENKGAIGRNVGVQHTTTPYVAFCDDDSWWEPEALTKAVSYFEQYPDVGLISGKILVNESRKLDPVSSLQSNSPLTGYVSMPGPAILGFLGCGIIVRKRAFMEVHGYNRHIYFNGEEELLGIDLAAEGWGLTYCEDVVGCHYPAPRSNASQRHQMAVRNRIQVAFMRRPWRRALGITFELAMRALKDGNVALGVLQGLARTPIALWNRNEIPWWVEYQIQQLEEQTDYLSALATQKKQQFSHTANL